MQPHSLRSHVVPFAFVGLGGGLLAAHLMDVFQASVVVIPSTTAMLCAALGACVAPRRHWAITTILGVPIAGALNALILCLIAGLSRYAGDAAMVGLSFSVPFVPALLVVTHAVRRVGRARPGSLLDRSDRRRVLGAVTAVHAGASFVLATSRMGHGPAFGASLAHDPPARVVLQGLALVYTLVLLIVVVMDLRAYRIASLLLRRRSSLRERRPEDVLCEPDREHVDLGLGESTYTYEVPGELYRGSPRTMLHHTGDALAVRDALGRALLSGVVALAASTLGLLAFGPP